ncbi:transcription factor Sp3 isoform X2 [Contarinia nasturtii]|uniref:transcription factor Sp3 isoform X2 n=1 Tax=Contarinia nasturtii TaxID=265458 RepID=UPI0012D476A5|nr:transcription factor Sp3 isoform X2 [Contarinia nasturtii]
MSGYKCVDYYELCRLCTASNGTKKVHIFSEEGRKKNLYEKIAGCLPIVVSETDKLPKIVCSSCLIQVETIVKFRQTCINAQSMLESCLTSSKLRNGGKDVSPKSPPLLKTISNTPITIGHTTLTKTPVQNSKNSTDFLSSIIQAVGIQNVDESNEPQIINNIQPVQQQQQQQQQPVQQYTITLDGKTLKPNQIHYKIEPTGAITIQDQQFIQQAQSTPTQQTISNSTYSQVNEFLKLKPSNAKVTQVLKRKEPTVKILETSPNKKPKINLVLASSPVQQQQHQQPKTIQTNTVTGISAANTITVANTASKSQAITLQDLKFLSSGNKCFLPITLKDGSNNDQQIMAQIDTKNLVLPGTYLQMKVDPQQITTVDGQQVVQLTSAGNLPTSISLAQPQYVQTQQHSNEHIQHATIVPETRTIFAGGQNITITQEQLNAVQDGKVQFTTLQNVAAPNITLPLPETSAITFQRIKVEQSPDKTETKTNVVATKPQVFKLPTLSNTTTSITNTNSNAQPKTAVVRKPMTKATVVTAKNKVTIIKSETFDSNTTTVTTTQNTNTTSGSGTTAKTDVPTCDVCEKVFKRKEHLAQHVKLHLGLRPFKCEEPNCNKAFSRKEHLMRHCVSHTGKKQFDCDICHKLFSRKDNLNKHKKSHEQKQQAQQVQQQQQHVQEAVQQPTLVYTVTEVN